MAKPNYGGWVSFTAHLAHKTNSKIHKVRKRDEKKERNFGYSCEYLNSTIDKVKELPNLMITAIDKNYHQYLEDFPEGTYLVIHDPTEVKGRNNELTKHLHRFKVITIRETVQKYLKEKLDIDSVFRVHPFYNFLKSINNDKTDVVSISRIDYDKHTEILCKANEILDKKIKIYGAKNDRYVYQKLLEFDSMKADDELSNYCGQFGKTFQDISDILCKSKVVVDMSAINMDGGGTQYSFLEAIYHNCLLVLNKKWVEGLNSPFKDGYNCLIVKDENELVSLLNNLDSKNISEMVNNSQDILKENLNVNWTDL